MAYRNVRPVVALLACVIVNDLLATALTYIVPLPTSAAAFAVVGTRMGTDPAAQLLSETVVVAALGVSVTDPTAFDRPAPSCWIARTIFFRSVSVIPGR
jgi:hypothetical protein